MQTYSVDSITEALDTMQGGHREPHIVVKIVGTTHDTRRDMANIHDPKGCLSALLSRDYKGPKMIAIPVLTPDRSEKRQNGRRFKENGEPMFTLTAQDRHGVALEPIGGIYAFNSREFGSPIMEGNIKTLKAEKNDSSVVLKIKEATKQGYAMASDGDSINLSVPESKTRRGRVGKGVDQTLDTSCNQGTPVILEANDIPQIDDRSGIYVQLPSGVICYAIWYEKEQCYITIRKLTPKECFRLQGWTDDYFEKAAFVNSDSQLYKQVGNGVTVDVVREIGERIREHEQSRHEAGVQRQV